MAFFNQIKSFYDQARDCFHRWQSQMSDDSDNNDTRRSIHDQRNTMAHDSDIYAKRANDNVKNVVVYPRSTFVLVLFKI